MAFRTDTPLKEAFDRSRSMAKLIAAKLANWAIILQSNITAVDAVSLDADVSAAISEFNAITTLPNVSSGIVAYAKNQYSDNNYDINAEFTAMLAALTAIQTWLAANIPANDVQITGGIYVGKTSYTPAQTANLLTRINAALALIA